MQNFNSNMDSEYADLYSQYTKMHSNSVQMDTNNSVLHYQNNDLKPMELQPDLQTNAVQNTYEQLQLDNVSDLQSRDSRDISQDLSLSYDNVVTNDLIPNNTELPTSDSQPKHETNCMDTEPPLEDSEKRADLEETDVGKPVEEAGVIVTEEALPESAVILEPSEGNNIDDNISSVKTESKPSELAETTCEKEKESEALVVSPSSDVCRICMDSGILISIFEDDESRRMCEKVMSCAAVQISENDGLPGFICNTCAGDLEIAYKFKTRCESSDVALRDKLGLKKKTIVKTEFVLIDCDNEPIVSDDGGTSKKKRSYKKYDDFEEDFSEQESDDPSYGEKKKSKKRRKTKKLTTKLKKKTGKKKKYMKTQPVFNESDDDVIEITKRPYKKRKQEEAAGTAPVGKYACTFCNKSFPYPSVLKLHLITHTKEKTHKCVICTDSFMYSKELYTHYKDAHPNEYGKVMDDKSKTFPCASCDKVFSQRKNLKVHESVHVRDKKYKCEACSQGFTNMTTLNMHKKQDHPGLTKPFKCSICDKRFKQQVAMERHMDNHRHQSEMAKLIEEKKPPSTKDLFKSIAPVTTTYWSDSFSD